MLSNRVRRSIVVGAVIALTSLLPSPRAQEAQTPAQTALGPTAPRDFSHDVPAHLAFVEGEVTLERDGKLEPAERNLALLAGDRLRTRAGRVEILYADSSTLAVDRETSLDLLSDSLVRLLGGRLRVAILRTTETLDYRIDSAAGSIGIQVAGEYRVQTGIDADGDPDVDLTVVRGSAELVNDNGRTLVRAGRHAFTSAKTAPSLAYTVNSAAWDDFDRWVEDRRTSRVGSISSAYLPEEVQYYGNTLDDYGTWGTDPSAGAVWYPRVSDDWLPYSQGRWSYTGYYGWVWVGIDAWSWPTHHYGSWGYSNRWYWKPNHYWGPAWVTWAVSPNYVSWCPRGYDGRPVDAFPGNGGYRYGEPWRTWTTLPAKQMTHNVWVTEHTVARNNITPAARESFVERPGGPMPAGGTAPRRSIAPLHAPTAPSGQAGQRGVAAPRGQGQMNDAGPFDAARVPRAGGASPSRGPVTYTVPSATGSGADSRARQATPTPSVDRTPGAASPSRSVGASSPDRSQSTQPRDRTQGATTPDRMPAGTAAPRDRMPAGPAPSIDRSSAQPSRVPRATPPPVEILRGTPEPPQTWGAVPRISDPPQAEPPSQDRGRPANRAVPPPSTQYAPPPSQSAPPSAAYPARRAEPQGPQQAMPPPSHNRGSDRPAPQPSAPPPSAQPSAPPSGAAPPPATARPSGRGGGGGQTQSQGQAVPRRGGGGGGDR